MSKWLVLVDSTQWYFDNFRAAAAFARTEEDSNKMVRIYKLVYVNGEALKD